MTDDADADDYDAQCECPECGGEGVIEMSFPVSSNAEEPDVREMACPECNDFEPDDYDSCDYALDDVTGEYGDFDPNDF